MTSPSLPGEFTGHRTAAPGGELFLQTGGDGEAVVLLHGNAQSGDMWGPLAAQICAYRTVLAPDLRGMCRSARPVTAYDKKSQAHDIHGIVRSLGFERVSLVAHDLGAMVAYAYAAQFPDEVQNLVFMEAPLPGVGPWDDVAGDDRLWHFNFGGPDMERLVAGRERIYFDHFWRFSARPDKIDEATRNHYAQQYAAPGAMAASFGQFAAFPQDAQDNSLFAQSLLTMPVLAVAGDRAFGSVVATTVRAVAHNVEEVVAADTGHWLLEEDPATLLPLILDFLAAE